MPRGRVLIIAGSDSGGGAGLQADIKTVTLLGGYAMTAVTAVTVQNTLGVTAVHPIPQEIVRAQIDATLSDIGADAVKIGMLGDRATVETVADALAAVAGSVPIVLDPVMIAKGGHALLTSDAVEALTSRLLPLSTLVTPNAPEAERLTGASVTHRAEQAQAAETLLKRGAGAALVKGGHIAGGVIVDVLATAEGLTFFEAPRIDTRSTHGTGCTLASAIAARLAQGAELALAVEDAGEYLRGAIRHAPGLGAGHGPLNHNWILQTTN